MSRFIIDGDKAVKKEKESGKLRMEGGAWSVNLDELPNVSSIVYITEKHKYTIAYEDAFLHGFVRVFNGEEKLIVPEKYWAIS